MKDRSRLRLWLAPFATNALRMNAMRALLARESTRDLSGVPNEAVVDAVCALLAADTVHIHCDVRAPAPATTAPKSEAPPPAPVVTPRPTLKTAFKPPAIDPPAFAPNVDLARQAAALVTAATDGAPFCPI